jgi:Uma2 family endonuclease
MSIEEFARLPDDGMKHELDERELIAAPPAPHRHRVIHGTVAHILGDFVERHALSDATIGSGCVLGPATVRGPDVSFVRRSHIPEGQWVEGAPDLVAEVVSPSDTAAQIERKVQQYLRAGAHTVWVVYPDSGRVHVFEANGSVRILEGDAKLEAPELLPGFSVPVRTLFE